MTNDNIRDNPLSVLKTLAPGGRGQGEGDFVGTGHCACLKAGSPLS